MAAMTIRKLSDAATSNIKLQAKANGRSAEAEARLALEDSNPQKANKQNTRMGKRSELGTKNETDTEPIRSQSQRLW